MARGVSMVSLRQSMDEYLAMRRSLGFKLQEAGLRLKDFVTFMWACPDSVDGF